MWWDPRTPTVEAPWRWTRMDYQNRIRSARTKTVTLPWMRHQKAEGRRAKIAAENAVIEAVRTDFRDALT